MSKGAPQLTITLSPNGDVSVTGPIANKMLCYSLLELGRDVIKDHHDAVTRERQRAGIVAPSPSDIRSISGGKPQ